MDGTKRDRPTERAILGAGCFWCIEAVLKRVGGVVAIRSGYMGGETESPTYREVCSGTTGHAEVVEVEFDPEVLPFSELLDRFWKLHDPTTLDRQGADIGTQYRSAIFYRSDEQRAEAERSKQAADQSGEFASPIVTEISPASRFYPAEEYHQDYFARNPNAPYCLFTIPPKLRKLGLPD